MVKYFITYKRFFEIIKLTLDSFQSYLNSPLINIENLTVEILEETYKNKV